MERVPFDIGPPGEWLAGRAFPVGGALFESAGPVGPAARRSVLMLDPEEVQRWRLGDPDDPFELVGQPLTAVALGYDLGRVVERLPSLARDERLLPDLYVARYAAAYEWDRTTKTGAIIGDADHFKRALELPPSDPLRLGELVCETPRDTYEAAVQDILTRIADGEIYQANYAVRFSAPVTQPGDVGALFRQLLAASPVPFAALLRPTADTAILSISPERFLRWDAQGHVETWPIKGTIARGATPAEDTARAQALRDSAKDAAEHVMIVDLERNDLGRVCAPGTVTAPRHPRLESYATVHHLVSTVSGQLVPGVRVPDLLRATFPGGSITGAPKLRAMETIEALEPVRRGPYCGAIGFIDDAGGDLNIAIRTAWLANGRLYYSAGGGIVADSTPEGEWEEAQLKAAAFKRGIGR